MANQAFRKIMRNLHRDIGYLMIGITIIFSISGITLIFRDTNYFKKETIVERQLNTGLNGENLARELRFRHFRVDREEGDIIYFFNGQYNKQTGVARYTNYTFPDVINRMNGIHKSASNNSIHWLSLIFGVLLFFLAVSSFWMFKPGSKKFKRGLIFAGGGFVVALLVLLL